VLLDGFGKARLKNGKFPSGEFFAAKMLCSWQLAVQKGFPGG
jgi:hypothetical protein